MRNLTAVLAVAFCLTFPAESANAQDYNSEIDQYVFMP